MPSLLGPLLPVPLTPQQSTVDPHICQRLPNTHRQVWLSLSWRHCSFLMDPRSLGFVCALQDSLCPQACGISLIPLTFNVRFPGDSQSLCWIPRLESLLWCLELSQQCKNFCGIIVLQIVGHPWQLYGGASGNLFQESLGHTLCVRGTHSSVSLPGLRFQLCDGRGALCASVSSSVKDWYLLYSDLVRIQPTNICCKDYNPPHLMALCFVALGTY